MSNGNFKVRCIDIARQPHFYTIGKVYEVVDGVFTWDNGATSINCSKGYEKFKNINDLNSAFMAKFEPVYDSIVVIYRKGRETIASLKDGNKVIKTAKAICNPQDTYDAEYGAKLAFARLYGLDQKVTDILLNGVKEVIATKTDGNFKARCIRTIDTSLTVGKIYEFKDGFSRWDTGRIIPQFSHKQINRFRNFSDLQEWFGVRESEIASLFEEVKEDVRSESFDWVAFQRTEIVAFCETEEDSKQFLTEIMKLGLNRSRKLNYENARYYSYNFLSNNGLGCGSLSKTYESHGIKIVPFKASPTINHFDITQISDTDLINEIARRFNA